ncbi:MAG: COX15/CtaA family protein [Gemmatimonadota bacterium]|nr:COX15/CtaA family protein [Gemmatimonadota bacterium]MDH5805398.1 COX15/CtaA family protein [Gemmatimonadota bacterium]
MKAIRYLSFLTAFLTYLLIVLGGIVRITGSGMGCGDHWPLCNGHMFPPLDDIATVIEWGHRMVVVLLTVMIATVAGLAYAKRNEAGVAGPGGPLRPLVLSLGLLVVQSLLGAITVWMELPPTTIILHFGTAMGMLAALLVAGLRAGIQAPLNVNEKTARAGWVALWISAATLLLGALTANLGAAGACIGFPLCNGRIWPADPEGGLAVIHWVHRLFGYGLTLHLVGMVMAYRKRGESRAVQLAAWWSLGVTLTQVAVAAAMVLTFLQPTWRAWHMAAGTAVWVALVILVWLVRRGGDAEEAIAG